MTIQVKSNGYNVFTIFLYSIFVLLLTLPIISCEDEEENRFVYYAAESSGPYNPGYMLTSWNDTERERSDELAIWYPCIEGNISADGHVLDGTPDTSGAPYPIIMFSHGSQGMKDQSKFLVTHLASHGYVIVAPDVPKNTLYDYDENMMGITALERPTDIIFNLDNAIELNKDQSSRLYGMLDSNLAAIMGHSFGGYTTVILSGAVANLSTAEEYCLEHSELSLCTILDQIDELGLNITTYSNKEDRFKCAFAMAPGGYGLFMNGGLDDISIPFMIQVGNNDTMTPYATEAKPIYDELPIEDKYLVSYSPAYHNAFTDYCGMLGTPAAYCTVVKEYIKIYAVAFFGLYLKQINDYESYLSSEYADTLDETEIEMGVE